jgi:aminocarboxymuconate-semialdehyde decarboxylase
MLGTDYPFPLGEQKMGNLVRSSKILSQAEKSSILEDNPKSFFFKANVS